MPLVSTQAVIKFAAKSKHNLHVKDVKLVELRNTWSSVSAPEPTEMAATKVDSEEPQLYVQIGNLIGPMPFSAIEQYASVKCSRETENIRSN